MAVAAKVRLKWTLLFLLSAALAWSCTLAQVRRVETRVQRATCQVAPDWTAQPVDPQGVLGPALSPMTEARGKVVLVALTAASSKHSLDQARKLGQLVSYFQGMGIADLHFILVNSAEALNQLPDLLLEEQSVTIVQEQTNVTVWKKLGGKKDDIFVYDRCGRLTYAIPFPLSIIHSRQQLVESSVISTYLDDLCGQRKCEEDKTNASLEDSVDAELVNTTHSTLVHVTEITNVTDQVLTTEDIMEIDLSADINDTTLQLSPLAEDQQEDLPTDQKGNKTDLLVRVASVQPKVQSSLWSLYNSILKYMPWTSKQDTNADRQLNQVPKYVENEQVQATVEAPGQDQSCQEPLPKDTCRAWTRKKVDHARICCNMPPCNRSAQYVQKHCRHYSEERCKKVALVLRCCRTSDTEEASSPAKS